MRYREYQDDLLDLLLEQSAPISLDSVLEEIRQRRGSSRTSRSSLDRALEQLHLRWIVRKDRLVPPWPVLDGIRLRLPVTDRMFHYQAIPLDSVLDLMLFYRKGHRDTPVRFVGPSTRPLQGVETRATRGRREPADDDDLVPGWVGFQPPAGARLRPDDSIVVTLRIGAGEVVIDVEPAEDRDDERIRRQDEEWAEVLRAYVQEEEIVPYAAAILHSLPDLSWSREYPASPLEHLAYHDPELLFLTDVPSPTGRFGLVAYGPACLFKSDEDTSAVTLVRAGRTRVQWRVKPGQPGVPIAQELTQARARKASAAIEEAPAGVYRFRVTLTGYGVSRVVELPAGEPLDKLHDAIQAAFDWDWDHAYAFFMDRRGWRSKDAYWSPGSEEFPSTLDVTLDELGFEPGQQFQYLFDFGDEWWHNVRFLGAVPREPGATYPRVVGSRGTPPPQYPE
ncbi:plasmid pRiA4b ORF-3 family protein [Limnochorda pilosa]|uniref:Plasmid pRiA4b Orf3-like domain-containing protein n=1 Tax=Limnochorda pilosa TaxID=1555112 RepID=A0A0K2SHY7_LIMPI|nr:plasmid pRiA4b ORF-3 family protein [Limnochorda pilosa]BAS26713.1 hypothetical protein LIP_0856 [Limnochorda pilosa]